jgi:VRR-NUC domain-containing protein
MPTARSRALAMTEFQFMGRIIEFAVLHKWMVNHQRPAKTKDGWRTATQGHAGFPDLVLARRGVLILAEVKSDSGKLSALQERWLAELGPHGRIWFPKDWAKIMQELT